MSGWPKYKEVVRERDQFKRERDEAIRELRGPRKAAPMTAQPEPTEVEERVIAKMRERRERGRAKYGTTMERIDLKRIDWMRHAQEEAMDFAIYLERLIRDEEDGK